MRARHGVGASCRVAVILRYVVYASKKMRKHASWHGRPCVDITKMIPGLCCIVAVLVAPRAPPWHHQRLRGGAVEASLKQTTYSVTLQDGKLCLVDDMFPSRLEDFVPILEGISPELSATNSATGGLFLHTAHDAPASEHLMSLGTLRCNKLLASARVTRYWMGPAFGRGAHHVPHDTQFLLLELSSDGPYAVMLPLVDKGMRATLKGGLSQWRHNPLTARGDELLLHAESGDDQVATDSMRALYVAAGADPYLLLRRAFAEVAEETGTFRTLERKSLPASVDSFGWCTWDAFYSKVAPQGVVEGVHALHAAGVPPRTLILDDGWQQVEPTPPDELAEIGEAAAAPTTNVLAAALTAVGTWVTSMLLRGVSTLFEAYYEKCVRRAPHGSLAARVWRGLVNSVLKANLGAYFDSETDFARQLAAFAPNGKFEAAGGEAGGGTSLASLVSKCKKELGVRHVYCWHALAGYWRGASATLGETANIAVVQTQPKPSRHLLTLEPQIAWDAVTVFGAGVITSANQLDQFYRKLHSPLAAAGVDGVKVDVQSGVPALGGGVGGGPHLARLYTKAMEASVAEHFGTARDVGVGGDVGSGDDERSDALHCINCMCHSTENLYQYSQTAVARASDDFYPHRPDSHTVHLVNVAYNSIFLGEICLPDWDMFHSLHEVGALHAAARAVGGCPVYVSDAPGQHDIPLLRRLVLPDGSVLRARLPGRPTRDCLFSDVGKDGVSALKIWNANTVGGIVGAFHVQGVAWDWKIRENARNHASPSPLTATVRPRDIETLRGMSGPFAAWRHRGGRVEVLETLDSALTMHLQHREWELVTIVPIQHLAPPPGSAGGGVTWAPLGLGEMLNSGGAIVQAGEVFDAPGGGAQVTFSVRGPGKLHAYCRPAPDRVRASPPTEGASASLPFGYDAQSGRLEVVLPTSTSTAHLTAEWDGPEDGGIEASPLPQ